MDKNDYYIYNRKIINNIMQNNNINKNIEKQEIIIKIKLLKMF